MCACSQQGIFNAVFFIWSSNNNKNERKKSDKNTLKRHRHERPTTQLFFFFVKIPFETVNVKMFIFCWELLLIIDWCSRIFFYFGWRLFFFAFSTKWKICRKFWLNYVKHQLIFPKEFSLHFKLIEEFFAFSP